ncbi:MAG: transglycosylase family protein [Acidimicrobiia bacterium]|nr:transglycosylase family protein [Acidimicrobiia bacterium]
MLTTRGDIYGDDIVEADQAWGPPGSEPAWNATDEFLTVPVHWITEGHPLAVKRSAAWRWRRRAAMATTIAGIALAVVTFSLGSPVSDYALISDSGNSSAAGGDNEIEIEAVVEPNSPSDTISLMALSAASPGALDLYSGGGLGGDQLNLAVSVDSTTTTTAPTTTNVAWREPVIEPESEWVDAGNGVLVPDVLLRIRFCESTNDYRAAHVTSSARGAYQFLSGSWSWYGHAARYGVATSDLATPAQQDEAAVITLKQDGTRPWRESFSCWGSDSIPANYATARPSTTTTAAPSSTAATSTEGDTTSSTDQSTTTSASASSSSTPSSTVSSTTTTGSTAPSSTASTISTSTSTTTSTTAGG